VVSLSATDPGLPWFRAERQADRAIVLQAYSHPGAEAPGPGVEAALREPGGEAIAELPGAVGLGGAREAGAAATRGVGVERELGDDQGLTLDVLQAEVEATFDVGEDPELDAKRFYCSDGAVTLVSADMLAALD